MAWYKTGTISVTSGQTAVTGVGTDFATNSRVGDGLRGPDGQWYEIVNIASSTTLGVYPAYQGATTSNSVNWMIAPLQGYNKESADRLRAITDSVPLIDSKQDKNAKLTALTIPTYVANTFPIFNADGSVYAETMTDEARLFNRQPDNAGMRTRLGLVKTTSRVDSTVGRVVTVGDFGLGATGGVPLPGANANQVLPNGSFWSTATWAGSPYTGTDGRNQGVIRVSTWEDGASYSQQTFTPINPSFGPQLYRQSVNGTWQTWTPIVDIRNATADPELTNGGIIWSGVVSGYLVTKFINGDAFIRGLAPITKTFAVNEIANVNVDLPISFVNGPVGYAFSAVVVCQPSQVYDMYAPQATYLNTASQFGFAMRNGSSIAQTFTPRIQVWGRWK